MLPVMSFPLCWKTAVADDPLQRTESLGAKEPLQVPETFAEEVVDVPVEGPETVLDPWQASAASTTIIDAAEPMRAGRGRRGCERMRRSFRSSQNIRRASVSRGPFFAFSTLSGRARPHRALRLRPSPTSASRGGYNTGSGDRPRTASGC